MFIFAQGGQDGTTYVVLRDTSNAVVTGLVFNSAGAKCYYVRPRGLPVQITLATLAAANSAHAEGGFKEVDATNAPGLYRLDLPDAAIASGENFLILIIDFTATGPRHFVVALTPEPSALLPKVVDDVSNSASTFKTDLTETATDHFRKAFWTFRTGALAGQTRPITAFNGTTKFVTVDPPFSAEPAAGDEGLLVNY